MDLSIFKVDNSDGAFLAYLKREALVKIEEYNKDDIAEYWYNYFKALIELSKASKNSPINDSMDFIQRTIGFQENFKYQLPMTPISITEKDFDKSEHISLINHKRTYDVIWNTVFKLTDEKCIYYRNAFNLHIRKIFNFIKNEVEELSRTDEQYAIYISKGGVISGDFIDFVYFRKKDYENGKLKLDLPIIIPACEVFFKDENETTSMIYVVDHREPKLKELIEKYDCPICNNTKVANYKLNLRNCKLTSKSRKNYSLITFDKPEICKRGNYEVTEKDGAIYLNCSLGIIAKWKDGHLTIYWNKCRYKKVNSIYWEWFTKHNLQHLKTIYKNNNNNITFIY